MALFHLLLMLGGDIKLNPGPKWAYGKKSIHIWLGYWCKLSSFWSQRICYKYYVNVQHVRRWLRDCLPLQFYESQSFFLIILNSYLSVMSRYVKNDVHIRSIRRWKHDYQYFRFTCSVDVDNADNDELEEGCGCTMVNLAWILWTVYWWVWKHVWADLY